MKKRPRLRLPLTLVVARYFLYVLVGFTLVAGVTVISFSALLSTGSIYPASFGADYVDEVKAQIAAQDTFDASTIPAAYRFAHLAPDTTVLASDMPPSQQEHARAVTASAANKNGVDEKAADNNSMSLAVAERSSFASQQLSDGSWCVLAYNTMPQWTDRSTRDTLPNPQDLLLAVLGLEVVALVVGVALRASHVLTHKMVPLMEAANAVGRQDLDEPVGTSNVVQIDDVLCAMEQMRTSLKESLDAQWAGEQRERTQIAAMAHDLKTPLTIIRGNADLLAEDAEAGMLNDDQRASVEAMRAAALTADAFITDIVSASHGAGASIHLQPMQPDYLAIRIEEAARQLTEARGKALQPSRTPAFEEACRTCGSDDATLPHWDGVALERAMLNLVGNAADHADADSAIELAISYEAASRAFTFAVSDHGPGFSPEALEHGRERFFRSDTSRTQATNAEPHFGLGLFIADDIARAHGGTLTLENRKDAAGTVIGAIATLAIPAQPFTV